MKSPRCYKFGLLLCICLVNAQMLWAQLTAAEESAIDSVFAPWKAPETPGVAACIIKDGAVIYLKGYGRANLETATRITPQTKFQLGELSKQFTTLAILLLEQQEKIALDDDIRKFLPELPEYSDKITINHLLNHTSGLHDIGQINGMLTGASSILTQAEALQLIAAQEVLVFKPGSNFSFHRSSTEEVLMAEIVARSSGQSFADFVKSHIFEPLGMENSLIREDYEAMVGGVAQAYQKEEEGYKKHQVLSSVVGTINAYSSAEDLAKWYLNFTHPKGSLGQLIQRLDTPVRLSNGTKYAHYWGDMAIGRAFTHPERGLPIFWNFGIQGGYGANVFRYIEQNITSFVLGNNNQYNGGLAMGAVAPLVEDLYLLPSAVDYNALDTEKLSVEQLKAFAGHYWFKEAGYASKVFVDNDTLRNQWIFTTRYSTLLPIADNTFQQVVGNEDIRLYKFKKGDAGMELHFTFNDSKPDIMKRYEPIMPSPQALQSYTGTYYNKAYACLFSFTVQDGKLIASNLNHPAVEFKPITKEVFSSTSAFMTAITFQRNPANEITGFQIDADGIHQLFFERVPAGSTNNNQRR